MERLKGARTHIKGDTERVYIVRKQSDCVLKKEKELPCDLPKLLLPSYYFSFSEAFSENAH